MSFSILLRDEHGNVLNELHDPKNLLHKLLPPCGSTCLLGYVDRFGDTVFNRLQMDPFLMEWTDIEARADGDEQRVLVSKIRFMAGRCKEQAHTYLVFEGD